MSDLPSIFLFTSNKYLIPDIEECNSSYHRKYQLALINDGELFINEFGGFFSRIHKKNGCHRYYVTYITEDIVTSLDFTEHIFYKFSSKYLGTNLKISMREFLMDDLYTRQGNFEFIIPNTYSYCSKLPFYRFHFKNRVE